MSGNTNLICRGEHCSDYDSRAQEIAKVVSSIHPLKVVDEFRVIVLDEPDYPNWYLIASVVLAVFVVVALWFLTSSM